ncbi:MAG TPA: DUF2946 family protein [Trinickia sp.]|uniref:DUF2946 family protein n=1 Tax=Trinickia sp. TaxID=2571163 RepID=UPI002CEB4727|nr:DUF2946 family protein [Trinickia sp.]HTI18071.1 DUF2946 family protein [Trinickia sp.]
MDEIVKAAIAKWPSVPHCTGWLLLDRRGQWRMRDERAQALRDLGAPVRHPALIGFINRNYERDERGQWFFQNGPQRVYVELAYTPWIVRLGSRETNGRSEPTLTDHTGGSFEPAEALIDEDGAVLIVDSATPTRIALLHDHDLGLFSEFATLTLDDDGAAGAGRFHWRTGCDLPIGTIMRADVPERFDFVPSPASMAMAAP